jgi:hypothetical protein
MIREKIVWLEFGVIGNDASSNEIIHGGMFHVDRSTGELVLPIQVDHALWGLDGAVRKQLRSVNDAEAVRALSRRITSRFPV